MTTKEKAWILTVLGIPAVFGALVLGVVTQTILYPVAATAFFGTVVLGLKCPKCRWPVFKKKTGQGTAHWGGLPPSKCTNCGAGLD